MATEPIRMTRWPFHKIRPWPAHCFHRDRCRANLKCWWGLADNLCAHQNRDIAAEVILSKMRTPAG